MEDINVILFGILFIIAYLFLLFIYVHTTASLAGIDKLTFLKSFKMAISIISIGFFCICLSTLLPFLRIIPGIIIFLVLTLFWYIKEFGRRIETAFLAWFLQSIFHFGTIVLALAIFEGKIRSMM